MPNSQTIAEIQRFFYFSRWRPPSWIFKLLKFSEGRVKRDKMRRRAKFCSNQSNHCWHMGIFIFQDGGRCHLRFLKFGIFKGRKGQEGQMPQHAKFRGDWANHCQDMSIYLFFNMAAVHHL